MPDVAAAENPSRLAPPEPGLRHRLADRSPRGADTIPAGTTANAGPAWVFCRRDVWHSGFPQACWRLPIRASGRSHRRQIAHGLFRASGMVMLQVTTHWFVKGVQVRMPGSVLESRGG